MVEESGIRTQVINKINVRKMFAFDLKKSCVSVTVRHNTSSIPGECYDNQHMCKKGVQTSPLLGVKEMKK